MLNVPNRIKELLHTDSVNKNIRIHFPNGERSDICNNQILEGSVEFTESLCSEKTLKFGLSESPIFQCDVYGVGNIKGLIIDVYCEVFCESTVEDAVWQSDIEHWVYQIPYGEFKVQSAQRKSDMIFRRILAYNPTNIYNFSSSKVEISRYQTSSQDTVYIVASNQETIKEYIIRQHSGNYSYDIIRRMFARLNKIDDLTSLVEHDLTISSVNNYMSLDADDIFFSISNAKYNMNQNMSDVYYFEPDVTEKTIDDIYEWVNACIEEMSEIALQEGKEYRIIYYKKFKEYIYTFLYEGMAVQELDSAPFISRLPTALFSLNGYTFWNGQNSSGFPINFSCPIYDDHVIIYPNNTTGNSNKDTNSLVYYAVPYEIKIEDRRIKNNGYFSYYTLRSGASSHQKAYKLSNSKFGIQRAQGRRTFTNYFAENYSDTGYAVTFNANTDFWNKVILGYIELTGCFAYSGRDKKLHIINIKKQFNLLPSNNLYPSAALYPEGPIGSKILPQDYQTCVYDDEYIKPFGAVQCEYTDGNNQNNTFILYLQGFSSSTPKESYMIYEVKDNFIIKSGTWNQTNIKNICQDIMNNITGISYMPVEFVGRGLPYVEAGDTFEILTKSNDSITTIVLNRTIKGEQHLVDSYKSV